MNKDIEAIFFDLDGTLLGISDEDFTKIYTKNLISHFIDIIDPEPFLEALWYGTGAMMQDQNLETIVLDAFMEAFTQKTGIDKEETFERFDRFYRGDFNKVKDACTPLPQTRELIDIAQDRGYTLVLATNPVFPEVATRSRCEWTNLKFDDFLHVTHAENSVICKPYAPYFEQLLDLAGVSPEKTLMVGNDHIFDMSASVLGIKTWLTSDYRGNVDKAGTYKVDYEGTLHDLISFIQ